METITATLHDFWLALPGIAQALFIVVAGWVLAFLTRWLSSSLLARLGFDRLTEKAGLGRFLRTGNVSYMPSKFLGILVYWFILLNVFILAARALDIGLVKSVADAIAQFMPSFIAFVLISLTGGVLATFLGNFTLTVAKNAGVGASRLVSRAVKYSVIAVALVSALRQLGVAAGVLENVVSIAFAALAFGAALSFGLGCKDLARGAMERFLRNLRESERDAAGKDLEG